MGADDYITKPFVPMEVLARVRSQLRQYTLLGGQAPEKPASSPLAVSVWTMKPRPSQMDREPANLTPMEFSILPLLMSNPGRFIHSRSL